MRTRAARAGAAWALTASLIGGCESTPRQPYADNPLLQARQPLVLPPGASSTNSTQVAQSIARPVVTPPAGLYQQQPTGVAETPTHKPPTYYPGVTTSMPSAHDTGPGLPAANLTPTVAPAPIPQPQPIPTPPAPVATAPATVVPASVPPGPVAPPPVVQAAVRTVDGQYGHAADYSWLQGQLDRHYRGHLELRYRPASEDDVYGGKVRLEDDPRLAEFRPGDIIAVEGEMLTDPDGVAAAPWAQYKRYHIRAIRLVEHK